MSDSKFFQKFGIEIFQEETISTAEKVIDEYFKGKNKEYSDNLIECLIEYLNRRYIVT